MCVCLPLPDVYIHNQRLKNTIPSFGWVLAVRNAISNTLTISNTSTCHVKLFVSSETRFPSAHWPCSIRNLWMNVVGIIRKHAKDIIIYFVIECVQFRNFSTSQEARHYFGLALVGIKDIRERKNNKNTLR